LAAEQDQKACFLQTANGKTGRVTAAAAASAGSLVLPTRTEWQTDRQTSRSFQNRCKQWG